jgi:hypothetical protein
MRAFGIVSVVTHAEPDESNALKQWVEIKLCIPKDFDFAKGGAGMLKAIQSATDLVGRGE